MPEHKIGLNHVRESDPLRGLVTVGVQGTCLCGWRGKLRTIPGKASDDAAEHHANATAAETLGKVPHE